MSSFGEKSDQVVASTRPAAADDALHAGDLLYLHEESGNGSKDSYQESTGAPVEKNSPLGLDVGATTTIFLNIGQMIGTGVFSTRESTIS
jgi:hypothetical protein